MASNLSPSEILHRSLAAMASIRAVHAIGGEQAVGHSSGESLRFQGECTQQSSAILTRLSYRGREAGRDPSAVNEEYIMRAARYGGNPARWSRSVEIWARSIRPPGRWRRTREMLNTRILVPMCPLLNVPPLHWSVPGSLTDLGRARMDGRSTVHIQSSDEGVSIGEFADLYIDPSSFHWVRIVLHGFAPGLTYRTTVDYSRYNEAARIRLPRLD